MKPLIGITCNYNEDNGIGRLTCLGMEGQDWNFLAGDYVYSIERAGGIPVLIPQCSSEEQISSLLDRLDGVLISGGHDVDPQHYNARLKSCCGDLSPKRDRQDIAVVRCAYQKKLPILAICRGIQIMNVAFGGTLYQDLALEGGFEYHSCRTSPRNNRVHEILTDEGSILRLSLIHIFSTLPNAKGDLYVQMGILRSLVNIKDLELLDEASVTGPGLESGGKGGGKFGGKNTGSGKIKMSKSFSVSPEINLIGLTVDEAIPQLDKYLDDAYLAHLPQVRVVHGRGTGALKAGVHRHLKKLKYVKEFRLGEFGEGDTGVTIVTFK